MTQIDIIEKIKEMRASRNPYDGLFLFFDRVVAEITALRAKVADMQSPNVPDENGFLIGQKVEKFSGDYQTIGEIRARYTTCKGAVRYVVEIEPQGFQHIFSAGNIRALP